MKLSLGVLGVVLGTALAAAACGGSGNNVAGTGPDGGAGAREGGGRPTKDGGPLMSLNRDGANTAPMLSIQPENPTLNVAGPGTTEQFHAVLTGSSAPTQASWTLGSPLLGTIDGTGKFTASGVVGGQVTIAARSGALQAQTTLTVNLAFQDNPGNLSSGVQKQLLAGGTADASFTWLYPYDATVFPRGILPPTLQYGDVGDAADGGLPSQSVTAAYVHVSFASFDYKGFYGANAGQVTLPSTVWTALTETATATDKVTVQVTKLAGGQVTGPVTETWTIAQGSLNGTIYYDSYDSPLGGNNGAVLSLKPGQLQPTVFAAGCVTCHSVSADGSTLEAYWDAAPLGNWVWDLADDTVVYQDPQNGPWSFAALYRDGSRFLRPGALAGLWPPNVRGVTNGAVAGPWPIALFESSTGVPLAAPGLDGVLNAALMPAFSPDGLHVAFNHYDTGAGSTLAVMDFDATTNTFSNLRDVATWPGSYVAWPSFTPDSEWLIYAVGTSAEFGSNSDTFTPPGPTANLGLTHVPSMTQTTAWSLDGRTAATGNACSLPYGAADCDLNFEPTVMPVVIGGYAWVVFTSRRFYGNTLTDPNPYACPACQGSTQPAVPASPPPRKKLWLAAMDIDPAGKPSTSAHDTTHPAFYLDGQELNAGNMRGFWVLSPCQKSGTGCNSGDECCTGYCGAGPADAGASAPSSADAGTDAGGDAGGDATPPAGPATVGVCGAAPAEQTCVPNGNACMSTADCCEPGEVCINGFCSMSTLQ